MYIYITRIYIILYIIYIYVNIYIDSVYVHARKVTHANVNARYAFLCADCAYTTTYVYRIQYTMYVACAFACVASYESRRLPSAPCQAVSKMFLWSDDLNWVQQFGFVRLFSAGFSAAAAGPSWPCAEGFVLPLAATWTGLHLVQIWPSQNLRLGCLRGFCGPSLGMSGG